MSRHFLALAQVVGTILVASLVPAITTRFGKRNGYIGAAVVAVMAFVLIYFVPEGSLPVALVAWFLFGLGTGGTNALMFSMQADTVDYGEWKTGTRAEGGSYSILSFVRKCGQGIGGFAGGAVIGAFGYVAGSVFQSPGAIQGIRVAAGWVPAGLSVIAALVLLRYPLGAEQHRQIVAELRRQIEQAVRDLIAEGVNAGTFRVPDVKTAARAVLSLGVDVARWYSERISKTPEELGREYAELVLRMLGTPP